MCSKKGNHKPHPELDLSLAKSVRTKLNMRPDGALPKIPKTVQGLSLAKEGQNKTPCPNM